MTLCIASGVLISQVALHQIGLTAPGGPFWTTLHDTTAKLTLGLVPVHVALRWRWIVSVARRLLAWRPKTDHDHEWRLGWRRGGGASRA
jgi:uncharacterized protein DUF4405